MSQYIRPNVTVHKCACIEHGDYSREEICTVFARNNFVKFPNCVLRTIAIAAKD